MFAQKTRGSFAGWIGCRGCLFVSMVLTGVDNRSNDCSSGGSAVSPAELRQNRAARLDVSQLLCLSVTWARGVDWSVLRRIRVHGSFLL